MYEISRSDNGFNARISAVYDQVDSVCQEMQMLLERYSLCNEAFGIILGVREVLNNAIRHGSRADAAKEIFFEVRWDGEVLSLASRDQGEGFDWAAQQEKHASWSDSSGRGLDILKQYFDSLTFNQAGNEIRLTKRITAAQRTP